MKDENQNTENQDPGGAPRNGQPACSISDDWFDEFAGRCVSCCHASPSNRKHEMHCSKNIAMSHGLRTKGAGGGGPVMGYPVHRLFGCVFWEKPNSVIGRKERDG